VYSAMINDQLIANLLPSLLVKEFLQMSHIICWSCEKNFVASFLTDGSKYIWLIHDESKSMPPSFCYNVIKHW